MKLFVGLGNPGPDYAGNRHNIGFMAVDEIARRWGFGPERSRFHGLAREGAIDTPDGPARALILKPQTYYNESGRAVGLRADMDALPSVMDVYQRDLEIERYFIGYLKHPYVSHYTGRGCPAQHGLRRARKQRIAPAAQQRINDRIQ